MTIGDRLREMGIHLPAEAKLPPGVLAPSPFLVGIARLVAPGHTSSIVGVQIGQSSVVELKS